MTVIFNHNILTSGRFKIPSVWKMPTIFWAQEWIQSNTPNKQILTRVYLCNKLIWPGKIHITTTAALLFIGLWTMEQLANSMDWLFAFLLKVFNNRKRPHITVCARPRRKRVSCRQGDGCENSDAQRLSNRPARCCCCCCCWWCGWWWRYRCDDPSTNSSRHIRLCNAANIQPITKLRTLRPQRIEYSE